MANTITAADRLDASTLRAAVGIMRQRAKRPKSLAMGIICRVLLDTAEKLDVPNG